MIYCSIDIETTGLNPDNCDVLQFAAVLDDLNNPKPIEQLPSFQTCFFKDGPIVGEPFALSMNGAILKQIANAQHKRLEYCEETKQRFMKIENLPDAFACFLLKNSFPLDRSGRLKVTVAGKNVAGFDLRFLNAKIKDWGQISMYQRVLDPAILYLDHQNDKVVPDMKTCMERAGISGEVAHTALEDALTVVRLLRYKLLGSTK
jgi:hypothetical protein